MSHRPLLRFTVLLSLLAPLPALAQTAARPPAAQAAGYHWHELVLQHAVPRDILDLLHWNKLATPPNPAPFQALPPTDLMPPTGTRPAGVLRIFALQSSNSLLVEATDDGFAMVAKLVKIFDTAPKQVQFETLLVAIPATRVGLDAPDADAARFLAELLRGERRVISTPLVTTTDGVGATISFFYPPPTFDPPPARLRLVQAGSPPPGGPATRGEFRVTPRINADGTLTLTVESGGVLAPALRTLRAGELAVFEETTRQAASGDKLFFFLRPTIIGENDGTPPIVLNGERSVTVTP